MVLCLKNSKTHINIFMVLICNYGFLMNKFSSKDIIKNLSKANMVSISPLEMIVKTKKIKPKIYSYK